MASKIEALSKNNYDTWSIQAKAFLIKNKVWKYVEKPIDNTKNDEKEQDLIAQSELILLISPSEIKQIKNCESAYSIWIKLKEIYASKGPARKANLLKQLILSKLQNGDIREHINKIMDIVDKLEEMDIKIHEDLLSIMMLYSLSSEYDNFRVAIESRDTLPKPDDLKIKILEEYDIAYAISVASRQLENPTMSDVLKVKRILRYLKGTMEHGLVFTKGSPVLQCYSDADHGGAATGHSTTGMVCVFSGPILWKSQKQATVALSSTEAELIAASESAKEIIWLKKLLMQMTYIKKLPILYVDSESAMNLANNPPHEFHSRTKHIKLRHFFIRECVADNELQIEKIDAELQIADMLTKPLYKPRIENLSKRLGLVDLK